MSTGISKHVSNSDSDAKKIDVLYIVGYGRSGSTMLEMALGGVSGFQCFGEVRYVWKRGCEENLLCSCGSKFWKCDLWPDVIRNVVPSTTPETFQQIHAMQKRADSILRMPLYLNNIDRLTSRNAECISLLDSLYTSLSKRTGANVLVDSSKFPSYGLLLSRVPSVRLHVIHLTRDCRAVANSWKRRKRRPEIHWASGYMPRYSLGRTAIKWSIHNRLSETLEAHAHRYIRLRYEDFVRQPAAELTRVLDHFGMHGEDARREIARIRHCPTLSRSARQHSVSGNPVRFSSKAVLISEDKGWKTELGAAGKLAVQALTWSTQRRYGYGTHSSQNWKGQIGTARIASRGIH